MNVLNLFHMRTKNYQQNYNYLNQEITNSKLGFFFIVKVQCTCSTTLDFSLLSVYFDNTTLNNSTFFHPTTGATLVVWSTSTCTQTVVSFGFQPKQWQTSFSFMKYGSLYITISPSGAVQLKAM